MVRTLPDELADRLVDDPPPGPAVYFLLIAGEVVYIGSSANPAARLCGHRMVDHKFDSATFLPVSPERRAAEEVRWIKAIRPRHNRRSNPDYDPEHQAWGCGKTGNVSMSLELHHALTKLAKANHRPLTWELRCAIEDRLRAFGMAVPDES